MSGGRTKSLQFSTSSCRSYGDYRVVVMGAAGVGKTSIVSQFLYNSFPAEYQETIEELHRGEFTVDGVKVVLDILDTSGAYSFPAMRKLAIGTSDAFILVFSVDSEPSFEQVKVLRELILDERSDSSDPPIIVVGNKTDVAPSERVIAREIIETHVCVEWNNGYVETSAKTNSKVEDVFRELFYRSRLQLTRLPIFKKNRQQSMPDVLSEKTRNSLTGKRHSCTIS